ncbi:MAG TPA: hypothetical protein VLE49_01840 [Anaerolineales bacterium]|nr:hypothetical protein [Anaerolineales bacterium]
MLPIHQQDNHLAIAFIGSMMRAGTVRMRETRHLQIEGLHEAQSCAGQLFANPTENTIASLIQNQEWH